MMVLDLKEVMESLAPGDFAHRHLHELRPADYRAQDGYEVAADNLEQFMRVIWDEGRGMRLVLGPDLLLRDGNPLDMSSYRTGTPRALALAHEIEIHLKNGDRAVTKSRNGWTGYVLDLSPTPT